MHGSRPKRTFLFTRSRINSIEQPVSIAPDGKALEELVIRPHKGWIGIDWSELWRYRELLYFLVWRDFRVRYKQTVLGVAWAVVQPVFSMIIFTVIFGRLAKIPSENFPYAVFVYAGLLPWTYFSAGVNISGLSLVNQQNLLTKIYFPRLFVPSASVGAGLVDLAIPFGVYALHTDVARNSAELAGRFPAAPRCSHPDGDPQLRIPAVRPHSHLSRLPPRV